MRTTWIDPRKPSPRPLPQAQQTLPDSPPPRPIITKPVPPSAPAVVKPPKPPQPKVRVLTVTVTGPLNFSFEVDHTGTLMGGQMEVNYVKGLFKRLLAPVGRIK